MKTYQVQYETKVTMTASVKAQSEEEAISLVKDGEYDDNWEEDSDGFKVTGVRIVEEDN